MKKVLIFIIVALFLISFGVAQNDANINSNTETPYGDDGLLACSTYTYSTCPEGCLKRCVSSERGGQHQTADCEGEGSCYSPSERTCPQLTTPATGWCEEGKIIKRTDKYGCPLPPKCITLYQIQNMIQERNKLRIGAGEEVPENCTRTGSAIKCNVDGGRIMTVTAGKSGNTIFQVKGINMSTNVTLYKANNTFYGVFKNNETKPVNYMPDQVREKIREKLRANLENETIELDEEGVYEMHAEKKARLFGLFRVREKIRAHINAETGEIIRTRASWWGFLATDEPSEIVGEFCGTVSPTGRNECCQRKGFGGWDNQSNECV